MEMFKNIAIVVLVFARCVLVNCGLIWLGIIGLALSLCVISFSIAGYIGMKGTSAQWFERLYLALSVATLYVSSIWYMEGMVAFIFGMATIIILLLKKDYILSQYTGILVLYFVTWDIAFYLMGDPVLGWVDVVLALVALACSGIWIYHAITLKH